MNMTTAAASAADAAAASRIADFAGFRPASPADRPEEVARLVLRSVIVKGEFAMGRLGLPEMVVILLIVILIFGASRLPDIGRGIGRGIKNFKDATRESGGKDDA
jgi:sec-independent protein translocase protein TatA